MASGTVRYASRQSRPDLRGTGDERGVRSREVTPADARHAVSGYTRGMAKKIVHQLVDDIDGTSLPQGEGETIVFGLDGHVFEIDLSEKNATAFREALGPFVRAARKASAQTRKPARRNTSRDLGAVREWARSQGHQVSDKGRVPYEILDAYDQAH